MFLVVEVFQFTHPGGVRRFFFFFTLSSESLVSIHAPGRGATRGSIFSTHSIPVSIHAPGRGATSGRFGSSNDAYCFNSRTREGCDYFRFCRCSDRRGFNSRTREGCDSVVAMRLILRVQFQFTHPGGVRLKILSAKSLTLRVSIHAPGRGATSAMLVRSSVLVRFNSRTREGCDLSVVNMALLETGFNSRTREGCDCRV